MLKSLLLSLLILGTSCQKEKEMTSKSLNLALTTDASTLDTALAYDTVSAKVIGQMNEALYQYHYLKRPFTIEPLLAESLPQISSDGLTYKIKIKKGIFYHPHEKISDQRTLKADDFITQIKRLALKSTNSPGWWLFDEKIVGLNEFRNKAKKDLSNFFEIPVEGLKAKDDYTLVIQLTRPYPQMIYALAMAFTSPTPKEILISSKNDLNRGVIGTGPFKLKEWTNGSKIELTRFKRYQKQLYPSFGDQYSHINQLLVDSQKTLPFLDAITFKVIKESQTRWLNFMSGKIDIITLAKDHFSMALDNLGNLKKEVKDKNIELQIATTLTYWWMAFNMNDKLVGENLNLRKAIAHAVDIDNYINIFTNNIALKANSIYPPGIAAYDPSNELPYGHDIKKAKMFLAKAGYPDGKGLATLNYDVRGNSTVSRQMGEFIKKELAKIGIKVKVIINPFTQFLRKARNGQLQFWQGGWALDYPSAENILQLFYSKNHAPGPNSTFYNNPKVDSIYQEISKSSDPKRIAELTKMAQVLVNKDLPWAMQFYSRNYILYNKKVLNFRQSDLINNNLKYINIRK